MSPPTRLEAALDVLRVALGAYLAGLRRAWGQSDPAAAGAAADIDRLLAGVGRAAEPSAEDRRAVESALSSLALSSPDDPLARAEAAFHLSVGDQLLVAAAWWAETDPQFATVLGCAHDDGARRHPSAGVIRLAVRPFGIDVAPGVDDHGPLVRAGLLEPGAGASGPVQLTPTARQLLAGLRPVTPPPHRPLPDRLARLVAPLGRRLAAPGTGVVVVRGPAGGGRTALAEAGIEAAGRTPVAADRPAAELRLLTAVGAAVAVVRGEPPEGLLAGWQASDGPLVVVADPDAGVPSRAFTVDIPPPSYEERAAHWGAALAAIGVRSTAAASSALAARFAFTENDIDESVDRAVAEAAWDGQDVDEDRVWQAARRQPEHALARVAELVTPAFDLDDLVVGDDCREQLEELIAHVALQHLVLDEWGFRRRLPRGQGVLALFTGPPGTGKTTAVEALASALRQDLYRIDLSAVVSKYIGETEKNLSMAFDAAERAGAVLFFDEADALFGKRTEVKDAHDRYANIEVNYLLQRVESFTGLVVLASNRRAAIDEAFMRRLRFVVRFDPPDADLRRRLWQRSFPPGAHVGDLDWDELARPELAGGSIQSVALHAAYRAARTGGPVTAVEVEASLRREFDKLGRAWPGAA